MTRPTVRRSAVIAVAFAAVFASASTTPGVAAGHTTDIRGNTFTPPDMTVAVGDTIAWHNFDPEVHSVVGGPINSPDIAPNGDFTWKFSSPGEVSYTCRFHPYMTGIVRVTSAGVPSPTPTAPPTPAAPGNTSPTTAAPDLSTPTTSTPAAVVPAARFAAAGAPLVPALVAAPANVLPPSPTIAPTTAPPTTATTVPPVAALQLANQSSGSAGPLVVAAVVLAALVLLSLIAFRSARRPM